MTSLLKPLKEQHSSDGSHAIRLTPHIYTPHEQERPPGAKSTELQIMKDSGKWREWERLRLAKRRAKQK